MYQEPRLLPWATVIGNVAMGLGPHVESRTALTRARRALDDVGLGDRAADWPAILSGGQKQRTAIGRAIVREPKLFLFDEPIAHLDAKLRARMRGELKIMQRRLGTTMIYVTHDQLEAMSMADRIAVMYLGRVVETAKVDDLFNQPAHPYTAALLASVPRVGRGKRQPGKSLSGEVPSPISPPSGCAFHPRCPAAQARCRSEVPVAQSVNSQGHQVACHFPITQKITQTAMAAATPAALTSA